MSGCSNLMRFLARGYHTRLIERFVSKLGTLLAKYINLKTVETIRFPRTDE